VAAWIFAGIALALTFPVWITVNYLGDPDNGTIVASYFGSFVMAGGFLAIGAAISALTKNQVIAFILSVVVCFSLLIIGFPPFVEAYSGWLPPDIVEMISSFSFQAHFSSISKGLIKLSDIVYFAALIAFFLFANGLILDYKKAD